MKRARTTLVTGAAGFLGSHLCDRLIERGGSVIALDDFSTGEPAHIAHLRHHPRFRFFRHDISLPLPECSDEADDIVNLACPASPSYYLHEPVRTLRACTLGLMHLLELARRHAMRLLHLSTSEVYGDPQVHPQPEWYWGHVNPNGPRSCYDEGKRVAEALCFAYAREHGVDIAVARLFNSYGPRLRAGDGRVASNFLAQALAGEPITVYGSGQQTRSFCYVDDTVRGLLLLLDSPYAGPVNIGNPDEHTVLELAKHVLRVTGSGSRIEFMPLPADDPRRRRPDIALARRLLGWEPVVPLEEGLRRMAAHLRASSTARLVP